MNEESLSEMDPTIVEESHTAPGSGFVFAVMNHAEIDARTDVDKDWY